MSQPMPTRPSQSSGDNSGDQKPRDPKHRTCTVISIEKSKGPDGAAGNDWYRYVIDGQGSPVVGYRRGKKSDVLEYLTESTGKLEERMNTGKAPRAASGRKPAQARPPQTTES